MAVLYRSNAQSRVIETRALQCRACRTACTAACASSSAPRSSTRWPTCACSRTRTTTPASCASSTSRRAASARARIEQLQDAARAAGAASLHERSARSAARPAPTSSAFVAKIDALREQTQGLTLREIIERVLRPQRPGRALQGRARRRRPHREPGGTGQRRRELRHAGRLRQGRGGAAGRRAAAVAGAARASIRTGRVIDEPLAPDAETGEIMSPLAAFLTHAALEAGDNQAQAGQDAVQLMTVHAAKGLEFDCVFITGLEEGLFPHENSLTDYDGLEEERRLMYVAITRARKRLYLSHSPDAHAARPDPLQRQEPLLRRAARRRAQVADAARTRASRPRPSATAAATRPRAAAPAATAARTPSPARPCRRRRPRPRTACARACRCSTTSSAKARVIGARRQRRRRARAGQLPPPRHQVAGAVGRQADAGLQLQARAAV